jgi:hypothetical protein
MVMTAPGWPRKVATCIPMLYSFASDLDPRAKMRDFHKVLTLISNLNLLIIPTIMILFMLS